MADLEKNYILSSGLAESARLHMQQWLWKMQVGWNIHPAVKIPRDGEFHIADLGCGNGAWLLDIARSLPQNGTAKVFLNGFDLSSAHYPAPENLPDNMTLDTLDVFTDSLPEQLVEKFDMVHIRAFAIVVKNGDPRMLINNVLRMLKPGGHLQWDELDVASAKAIAPDASVSCVAAQELTETVSLSIKNAMAIEYSWISKLGPILEQCEMRLVDDMRMAPIKELRKPMTETIVLVMENLAKVAVKDGKMIGTDREWAEVWRNAGMDLTKGVSIVQDMVVCVGQKPA